MSKVKGDSSTWVSAKNTASHQVLKEFSVHIEEQLQDAMKNCHQSRKI